MAWHGRSRPDRVAARDVRTPVEELPGGLTNVNLKVTHRPAGIVRGAGGRSRAVTLLAIDRDHEHHNSVAAAEAGVGAPVIDYLPEPG